MAIFDPARLRELRERRVMTQRELAVAASVRQGTIADIEAGKHKPRPTTIRRLAKVLGVQPEDLLEP